MRFRDWAPVEEDIDPNPGHLAPPVHVERGHGFEAILLLKHARTLAGDERFGGSAIEALRRAGRERDADIRHAVTLLKAARPVERIAKSIAQVPEVDRYAFRRRMLLDFDHAISLLVDKSESLRRSVARIAARDAQNWAGLTVEEKEARWAETFERAMDEFDRDGRARGIPGAAGEKHVRAPRPHEAFRIFRGQG